MTEWPEVQFNRWIQPDTIVPQAGNPQDLNRFSYTRNNPLKYNDPTGHDVGCPGMSAEQCAPPPKPPIVPRSQWGAKKPGSVKRADNAEWNEGLYPDDSTGYKDYLAADPNTDLATVLNTIVIHHEGDDAVYDIQTLQTREMENGWYDIPYHYIIGLDGTIFEGRDIGVRGTHVSPNAKNTGKIGILLMGDFNPGYQDKERRGTADPRDDTLTPALSASAVELVNWLHYKYGDGSLSCDMSAIFAG